MSQNLTYYATSQASYIMPVLRTLHIQYSLSNNYYTITSFPANEHPIFFWDIQNPVYHFSF